jgi:hypothetical protein
MGPEGDGELYEAHEAQAQAGVAAGRSPPPGGLSFPRDSPGHGLYLRWVAPSPAPPQDAARATPAPGGGGRLAEASQVLTTSASASYTPPMEPCLQWTAGDFPSISVHSRPFLSILSAFLVHTLRMPRSWPCVPPPLPHARPLRNCPPPGDHGGLQKPRPRRYTPMLQHLSCPSGIFPALVCIFLHFSAPFLRFSAHFRSPHPLATMPGSLGA